MTPYKNLSGKSGIASYSIGWTSITIEFKSGGTYLYDYSKPGARHIGQMKALAAQGSGLATYINKFVRDNYAAKL